MRFVKHAVVALLAARPRWAPGRCARSLIRRATSRSSSLSRRAASPIRSARLVGKGLGEKLGRTVVVENRGGAGGNIAAACVARAAPDGYTLLVTTTAVAINETLRPNKGFAASDLKPVAIVASSPEALRHRPEPIRPPTSPSSSRTAKGKSITFASAGVGSGSHIAAEYFFKEIAKINAVHVPFQGGAPAIAATIGNQVDLIGDDARRRRGGADRAAASSRASASPATSAWRSRPNVPTYAEAGYPLRCRRPGSASSCRPAPVPEIIAKLNATIEQVMKDPALQQKLTAIGFDPIEGIAGSRQIPSSRPRSRSGAKWSKHWGSRSSSMAEMSNSHARLSGRLTGINDRCRGRSSDVNANVKTRVRVDPN